MQAFYSWKHPRVLLLFISLLSLVPTRWMHLWSSTGQGYKYLNPSKASAWHQELPFFVPSASSDVLCCVIMEAFTLIMIPQDSTTMPCESTSFGDLIHLWDRRGRHWVKPRERSQVSLHSILFSASISFLAPKETSPGSCPLRSNTIWFVLGCI